MISFHFQNIVSTSSLIGLFLFIITYIVCIKTDLFNKNYLRELIILSIIISIIYTNGRILNSIAYSNNISFWKEAIQIKNIVAIIGNSLLVYLILINVVPFISNINIFNKEIYIKNLSFKKCLLFILICWLPYYIIYYPGILTSDTISQLNMISGTIPFTNHHPVICTLVIGLPYKLMSLITGNSTLAVGITTLIQMIIMAGIFSYAIMFLKKKNVSQRYQLITLLFFALFPINGFYSITLWKDIIFSGLILLLIIEIIKLIDNKDNLKIKNTISFIIISILCMLYRSNALYMYLLFIFMTFIIMHKYWKYFIKSFTLILVIYFVITGPVFSLFKIIKPSSSEYIAIPLQQIGRMAYKDVEFTKGETKLLNDLIGVENLKESYNPQIVDSIKFNKNYNVDAFNNKKKEYLYLWLNLCRKHPGIATEAYFISTLGYHYSDTNYWIVATGIDDNELGIEENNIFSKSFKEKCAKLGSRSIPVFGILYSIGFCYGMILLLIYMMIKKKNTLAIYCTMPIIGIWITMMIATPVFSEFRYVYSAFVTMPVIFILNKLIKKEG